MPSAKPNCLEKSHEAMPWTGNVRVRQSAALPPAKNHAQHIASTPRSRHSPPVEAWSLALETADVSDASVTSSGLAALLLQERKRASNRFFRGFCVEALDTRHNDIDRSSVITLSL